MTPAATSETAATPVDARPVVTSVAPTTSIGLGRGGGDRASIVAAFGHYADADDPRNDNQTGDEEHARLVATLTEEREAGRFDSPAAVAAIAALLGRGLERPEIEALVPEVADPEILDAVYERARALELRTDPRGPEIAASERTSVVILDDETAAISGPARDASVGETTAASQTIANPVYVFSVTRSLVEGVAVDSLGREVTRRFLLLVGFSDAHADQFLAGTPDYTYRESYGDGAPVSGESIRAALADKGHVEVKVRQSDLEELTAIARRGPEPQNSVSALPQTEEQAMIRTLTDWVDSLTGTTDPTGDWLRLNAFLNGLIRAGGRLSYMTAGINRLVADGFDLVLPPEVAEIVDKQVDQNRRWGDAMTGASTQVTEQIDDAEETLRARGESLPFLVKLPGLLGENPETILAAMGPKGQIALAVATPVMSFLQSYGQGRSLSESVAEAGWSAVESAVGAVTGKLGVSGELVADIAATYAIGKLRGKSDAEIKEEIALALLSSAAAARPKGGGPDKAPGIDAMTDRVFDSAASAMPKGETAPIAKPRPEPPAELSAVDRQTIERIERFETPESDSPEISAPKRSEDRPLPSRRFESLGLDRGKKLGDGSHFYVYAHPTDPNKVVKVLRSYIDGGKTPRDRGADWRESAEYQNSVDTELDGRRIAPEVESLITADDGAIIGAIEPRVPGRTLRSLVQGGELTREQLDDVKRQVRAQLEALHADGAVHGDPNMGNIMVDVDPDGRPRVHLIDFDPPTGDYDGSWDIDAIERKTFPLVEKAFRDARP